MGVKVIAQNRKAFHDYFIEQTYESGIELTGTEIKSVRQARVNLKDSFVRIKDQEAFLCNCHIDEYDHGNRFNHDPTRQRKLLLHKREIMKLTLQTRDGGYTIVPTKVYLKNGLAKVEIAIAKGKKLHDKREDLKQKDAKREMEREIKNRY